MAVLPALKSIKLKCLDWTTDLHDVISIIDKVNQNSVKVKEIKYKLPIIKIVTRMYSTA